LALCSSNLASPEIALPAAHFNTVLYAGNAGSNHAITGAGFQSDLTWIKVRGTTDNHFLTDSVRSNRYGLSSNIADAANSKGADVFDSFDSDGFTVTHDPTYDLVNRTSQNYVAWNWKAGGAAASNTDGTITSSVSANPTAGFSIVKYAGNNTSGATVGHGLSETPELIIIKNTEAYADWVVYSEPVGPTKGLQLNGTGDAYDYLAYFNDTSPSSSVFSLGDSTSVNADTEDMIAYCFAGIEGYSKVGSYEGNNDADGSFIYLGFKPEFFLVKDIDSVESWAMWDGTREPYNKLSKKISPDSNVAEYTANTTTYAIDFLSNGVKLRSSYSVLNAAESYIYYAVAESPFKTSNAR